MTTTSFSSSSNTNSLINYTANYPGVTSNTVQVSMVPVDISLDLTIGSDTVTSSSDPSLVVGLSPNTPLPSGTNTIGSVTFTTTNSTNTITIPSGTAIVNSGTYNPLYTNNTINLIYTPSTQPQIYPYNPVTVQPLGIYTEPYYPPQPNPFVADPALLAELAKLADPILSTEVLEEIDGYQLILTSRASFLMLETFKDGVKYDEMKFDSKEQFEQWKNGDTYPASYKKYTDYPVKWFQKPTKKREVGSFGRKIILSESESTQQQDGQFE